MPVPSEPRPRWTSRKFILAVSAQVTSLVVLIWPAHQSEIVQASTAVTSLLVILATSLGYLAAEGAIDARRAAPDDPPADES